MITACSALQHDARWQWKKLLKQTDWQTELAPLLGRGVTFCWSQALKMIMDDLGCRAPSRPSSPPPSPHRPHTLRPIGALAEGSQTRSGGRIFGSSFLEMDRRLKACEVPPSDPPRLLSRKYRRPLGSRVGGQLVVNRCEGMALVPLVDE